MRKSVYERFDAKEALEYDSWKPYRPETLRNHVDFARFHRPGAAFRATSLSEATALADDPEVRKARFTHTLLDQIDQVMIDNAAAEIYPNATIATRNRQVYTPIVAVLRRAGIDKRFKRPKGWQSPKTVSWLEPAQAFAVLAAADEIDAEFGLFLRLLCYTGMRLGEAISTILARVDLEAAMIYRPKTKNDDPRNVFLPSQLVVDLANHPRGLDRKATERLFRFHINGHLRNMLKDALTAAGVYTSLPPRQRGFHLFRHTWTGRRGCGATAASILLACLRLARGVIARQRPVMSIWTRRRKQEKPVCCR
jgi:integrase